MLGSSPSQEKFFRFTRIVTFSEFTAEPYGSERNGASEDEPSEKMSTAAAHKKSAQRFTLTKAKRVFLTTK
ncbi:hypothetical protein, partial [Escherichia coli]|uniref:hypothetical protein n=1 Tax=Escherichia coli TaxID=562 RepID=UPI0019D56A5C